MLLTFVPADNFTLDHGEDATITYLFNKHIIRHRFCKTCGAQPFAEGEMDGKAIWAVNLRCVPAANLDALKLNKFDGASR